MTGKQIIVKVKRQVSPQGSPYWEEFALQWRPAMNVIICLRDIAENPVTRWKKDDAGFLRFELSGRSLRLLRHAGERQGSHGMFGAGGQTGAADSA